jgi:hypothetical protein
MFLAQNCGTERPSIAPWRPQTTVDCALEATAIYGSGSELRSQLKMEPSVPSWRNSGLTFSCRSTVLEGRRLGRQRASGVRLPDSA